MSKAARADTGGSAGAGGFDYQHRMAAWLAVTAVAASASPGVQGLWTGAVEQIACETGEPVDDCRVRTSDGQTLALQAKRSITLSQTKESEFGKTIAQFVEQHLMPGHEQDRLVLVTSRDASKPVRNDLAQVLDRLRNVPAEQDVASLVFNSDQTDAYDKFVAHANREWAKQRGSTPSAAELRKFLAHCHVWVLDVEQGGLEEREALQTLRTSVITDPGQADAAWHVLLSTCAQMAINHSGTGMRQLQKALSSAGIALATIRDFTSDVQCLTRTTQDSLDQLGHGLTTVPTPQGPLAIARTVTGIDATSREGSVLVVGEPGAGKTVVMHELAREAIAAGRPVLFLSVAGVDGRSPGMLQAELDLQHPLVDVLEQWQPGSTGLLAIDALDAARVDASTELWRSIIADVNRRLPNWQVVASIRTWDLQHSPHLRALFPGGPVQVSDLTDEEVAQVTNVFPSLRDLLSQASVQQRKLMRNPFNLRLAAELLLDGAAAAQLRSVDSRLDLLARYWEARVTRGTEGIAKTALLGRLCAAAVQERRLAVPAQKILEADTAASDVLRALLSSSVLTQAPTVMGPTANGPLQFAHHVLFDYAVAVAYLSQTPDGLQERLDADPDLLLFARPSIDMYLRTAWARDPGVFCALALALMTLPSPGMAATALADVVTNDCHQAADLEPLLSPDPRTEEGAKRVLAAIAIAVSLKLKESSLQHPGVWAEVAERLSRTPARSLPALGVLVTDLTSHRAVLDEQQLRLCGLAARRLLEHLWTQPPAPASRLAITAVIQTAASDLTATETLLRRAVESPQLEERGYNDLDSMNSNISELMDLLPGLAEDLYVAMLSHTETSSASTQLGSGSVLTLVSNRRQDFDAAKYPLVEHFPAVLRSLLPRALAVLTRLAVAGRDLPEHSAVLGNRTFVIIEDGSRRREFASLDANSDPTELLDAYQDFAVAATETQAQALCEALTSSPRAAVVWRRTLRAAAANPALTAFMVSEPADVVTQLLIPDLVGPACELISAVHPTLEPAEAARLESAILAIRPAASHHEQGGLEQRRYRRLVSALSAEHLTNPSLTADRTAPDPAVDADPMAWGGEERAETAEEDPADAELRQLTAALSSFASTYLNGTASSDDIASAEHAATRLEAALPQTQSADLRTQAEDALADAAEIWTRSAQTPSAILSHARTLLLSASRSPRPEPTPENATFNLAIPQGPRTEAARGLGQLAGIPAQYNPEVTHALLALTTDPVGAIRHTVALIAPSVAVSDTGTAWEILEYLAEHDIDDAVLAATVTTACFRMNDAQRGASILATVMQCAASRPGRDTAASACATAAGLLWIHHTTPGTDTALTSMITRWPDGSTWSGCLHELRVSGALTHDNDAVRRRALRLMQQLAEPALDRTRHALLQYQTLTDAEREQFRNTAQLLDHIASQLYYAGGGVPNSAPPTTQEARLLDEAQPLIKLLSATPIARTAHHLVRLCERMTDQRPQETLLTVRDIITQVGAQSGYTADTLGVGTCVTFVERILADHRSLLRNPDNLTALRQICDAFIDAGWPQAHKLVFGIEQIFR
ncbi:hypothetical protein GPA10_39005 [Streptomyces sp. p1417]|uniref:Uncharacterized protein n=1 Tax=Streptomyces typhae TaxID=2681492 RepID=A0A6L6X9G0_9ACTN|nr:ATP-binding protein [Streptomyces typhae]MVO90585.1 hypothetical protein [Streptomyces typhae]